MQTAQIASIMCKSENWVRLLSAQIYGKLNFISRRELYNKIIEDCTFKTKEELIA